MYDSDVARFLCLSALKSSFGSHLNKYSIEVIPLFKVLVDTKLMLLHSSCSLGHYLFVFGFEQIKNNFSMISNVELYSLTFFNAAISIAFGLLLSYLSKVYISSPFWC